MQSKTAQVIATVFFLTSMSYAPGAFAQSHANDYPWVYRISASGCSGKDRAQSGFRVKGTAGIVTALHGIIGCKSFSAIHRRKAEFGPNTEYAGLQPETVNVAEDLVVLSSPNLAQEGASQGFDVSLTAAQPGSSFKTVGYPHGVEYHISTTLALRGTVPLNYLVPMGSRGPLMSRKSPDIVTSVLSIEGHLTVGHSGAPVLDSADKVVGVANGGLAMGASEISWAIPWAAASGFERYDEKSDALRMLRQHRSDALFAMAADKTVQSSVQCFSLNLDPIRNAGLNDIVATVDDPMTYQQLAYVHGLSGSSLGFTIYRDRHATVTIAVPDGWQLSPRSDTCVAQAPKPYADIEIVFRLDAVTKLAMGAPATPGATVLAAANSILLEHEFDTFCSNDYIIDPSQSNASGRPVFSRGIIARRVSYARIDRRCNAAVLPSPLITTMQRQPPAWATPHWHLMNKPPIITKSLQQCSLVNTCPQQYVYPDAWGIGVPPELNLGWGFASYMVSGEYAFSAQMRMDTSTSKLNKTLDDCVQALSSSSSCKLAYDRQQAWGAGVLAATASSVDPPP